MRHWHRPAHESRKHLYTDMPKALRDLSIFFFFFAHLQGCEIPSHTQLVFVRCFCLQHSGVKNHTLTPLSIRGFVTTSREREVRRQDSLARGLIDVLSITCKSNLLTAYFNRKAEVGLQTPKRNISHSDKKRNTLKQQRICSVYSLCIYLYINHRWIDRYFLFIIIFYLFFYLFF